MAAMVGPDIMLETPTRESFELSVASQHPNIDTLTETSQSSLTSQHVSSRSNIPPNPHFIFPMRSTSSAPSSFSRATGRRPHSVVGISSNALEIPTQEETRQSFSPALPEFSFNPGAALSPVPALEATFLNAPQSPPSPRLIAIRPGGHGHKRGGSEFVGGSIRGGDSITVISGSPTKSESGILSPPIPNAPPRRGHAHRRSAAISSHDLSSLVLPTVGTNLRGSSAPPSPAALNRKQEFSYPDPNNSPTQSEPFLSPTREFDASTMERPIKLHNVRLEQPPKPANRNRVGFSDTLEFIPRPLSMVSSDTSSTVTARPGHSVSGSISSIVSMTNTDRETASPRGPTPPPKLIERRPSTAGAILERTPTTDDQEQASPTPKRRGSIPYMGTFPSFVSSNQLSPSPTKVSKRWSFFAREPHSTGHSPTFSPPFAASSSEPQENLVHSASSPSDPVPNSPIKEPESVPTQERSPSVRKKNKKQKKVKTWAGSILSRKSKAHGGKKRRRTPTPSRERDGKEEDVVATDMAADPEPVMPTVIVTETNSEGDGKTWNAPRLVSVPDEDNSYPMIDLDAALGPFNTPLPRNPEWEAAQKAGGLSKRKLHSAAGMSRFTGPGMHYSHRRAESAPEMVPFEAARLGMHRFESSSTMADVFEEDEEEDDRDANSTTDQSTPLAETPIIETPDEMPASTEEVDGNVAPLEDDEQRLCTPADRTPTPSTTEPKDGDLRSNEERQVPNARRQSQSSTASFDDEILVKDGDLEVAVFSGDDNSAAPSPRQISKGKDLAPVDISPMHLPSGSLSAISPYSMSQSSSFPSPRSPVSYDTQRISTAPSSVVTEDNFQSLLMGEPGPEVRYSVDDIPSLTSSNSTMTRDSIIIPNPRTRPPATHNQPRPASFTSTAFGRRRSSLASLSRFINSSYGERSKLSMEVRLDNEPEKKAKVSKSKRLSRMMQFWKSKDSNASE